MLEKDEKNISEKEEQLEGYWTTDGHIDLMNDIGEFFSLTDVQECADDPSSIVQLEDSDNTKSNESIIIATEGTNSTQSYHDLDSGTLSTPPSEGSVTQSEWTPFIPLKSSTIQIHGNEIRHSPKQPTQVNSEESVQVQVPPLRVPIIRRLEDSSKEKPKSNRGKKVENLQRKLLKKKSDVNSVKESICKAKGNKRQYKKGRNLESEFEENTASQLGPTVTIHHRAHTPPVSLAQSGIVTQDSLMKSNCSQGYQVYRDGPNGGQSQCLNSNSSGNTEQSFGNPNILRANNNFNQRAQMIPDPRNQWSNDQTLQNGQGNIMSNRNNTQPTPNVCVNANGMFSRSQQQNFHEGPSRGYSIDGNSTSSNTNARTANQNQSMCNDNHRRMFQNNPERFEQMWPTSSLSPVERLFRNRISEVSEVRERCGDVQKFMKNSQLYKQLLAPIKDEAVKSCDKGSEPEDMMADVKKVSQSQFNGGQPSHGYDLPNEWTKVPTVPKPIVSDPMRSTDSKLFNDSNYMNFNSSVRRDIFSSESMMSGNPYDHVSEINDHFSKGDLQSNGHDGVSSSKQVHLPNWLKPHTIAKDYEAMFMEILKLRFCIYSERARNDVLQAENFNLRRLMNLQRNLQTKGYPLSAKNSSCENVSSSSGGHGTYFRAEENMEHRLNPGLNSFNHNEMFDSNCVSNTFGQLTRESIQRNGHLQPPNNVYYNTASDCNVPQQQQRQPHNFGVMNMMRR